MPPSYQHPPSLHPFTELSASKQGICIASPAQFKYQSLFLISASLPRVLGVTAFCTLQVLFWLPVTKHWNMLSEWRLLSAPFFCQDLQKELLDWGHRGGEKGKVSLCRVTLKPIIIMALKLEQVVLILDHLLDMRGIFQLKLLSLNQYTKKY